MPQQYTASQVSQRSNTSQVSQRSTTSHAPLPNFTLDGITVTVKSARNTHQFLRDVFAQPNTFINWDPAVKQKGWLPQLTKDGMHTDFHMSNTAIRFSTGTPDNPVGQNKVTFKVQVQDVDHIRQVLDGREWQHKRGTGPAPRKLRWIKFPDPDFNTWHVTELRSK